MKVLKGLFVFHGKAKAGGMGSHVIKSMLDYPLAMTHPNCSKTPPINSFIPVHKSGQKSRRGDSPPGGLTDV